ncbi:MAG: ABC transporter permease [Deltaproteobacteria bacterium]|nr:ABC transporter permease [Deltaproteobacteria bacterium]MBI3387074.1 ABC transporter permease [Deltaproteobacteria bacterium]
MTPTPRPTDRLARYFELVWVLARRDFEARYRGNVLGWVTGLVIPLAFLVVYSFVFSSIAPIRVRPGADRADYALFLFSGLLPWTIFADCATRAPRLIRGNAHLVRKVAVPLSALPLSIVLASYLQFLLGCSALFVVTWLVRGAPPWLMPLAPLALVGHLAFCAGAVWFLAAVGAFIRDLGDAVGPLLTMWLFVTPVLYPASNLEALGWLRFLNPLTPHIAVARDLLFDGRLPSLDAAAVSLVVGGVCAVGGWLVFRTARPAFADVV